MNVHTDLLGKEITAGDYVGASYYASISICYVVAALPHEKTIKIYRVDSKNKKHQECMQAQQLKSAPTICYCTRLLNLRINHAQQYF
jgi:hypothetical protein